MSRAGLARHTFSDLSITPTWGSQSWLQPPFEAAPRSTTETALVVAKPRLLSPAKRPHERRLQPGLAARIGCPTSHLKSRKRASTRHAIPPLSIVGTR